MDIFHFHFKEDLSVLFFLCYNIGVGKGKTEPMNRIYAWLGPKGIVPNTNKSPRWYNGPEYKQDMYPQLRQFPLVVSGLAAIGNYHLYCLNIGRRPAFYHVL